MQDAASDRWLAGGWLDAAQACPSPNCNARPPAVAVELVVIHSISLPPGQFGGDAIEHLFTNRLDLGGHPYFERLRGLALSSHFVIGRNGELKQFVGGDERAWHAGRSVWRGRENCNDFSIGIELEGLEGRAFAPPQYTALLELLPALARRYPVRGIAGHEHVAPMRKADPGAGFEWRRLAEMLRWPREYFPAGVTGAG
ncbi:MAG: 1,6-anhydro-N-acetylmuramyl-L-alanine amidase AmpD [Burkholderiaceae bacterium]|nr:1,6-anhydro-N-acetylmuramyl-L-alanine amidase AmpD [Burkholderiaceae bacterium]